jgi:hypothetical protein
MIIFKETVDDEHFMEIVLTDCEAKFLEKHGTLFSKEKVDDEVINFGIRIDDFDKIYYSKN